MQHVSKDAFEMTTYVSRNQEICSNLLKKPPDKVSVSDTSDIESVVHVHLFYFFDAVMPILQVKICLPV